MIFETKVIEQDKDEKPTKWVLIIEQGENDSIQIELDRNQVFDLYEASRKAFNEYNRGVGY